ncbi:hypothetical protein pb186bvf_018340 [Paramecium bursaria]
MQNQKNQYFKETNIQSKKIYKLDIYIIIYINGSMNNLQTNLKEIKYSIKNIDSTYNFVSQISYNGQYLAYGGNYGILKIYDLNLDKIIKIIIIDHNILVCQFTFDSSKLYVGSAKGYVFGYDVLNNFKINFKQTLDNNVYHIVAIKNIHIITFSSDKTIKKTDIKRNKQIFKYSGSAFEIGAFEPRWNDYIDAIDYNQRDDLIIIGYFRSIQLWNCMNRKFFINDLNYPKKIQIFQKINNQDLDDSDSDNIDKFRQIYGFEDFDDFGTFNNNLRKYSHKCDILQIQLINDNQYLLSLDVGSNLFKWKIDYIKKDLIKIQEFRVPSEIQSFYSVNQEQNLLLMCQGYLKVINTQGETIYILYHQQREFNIFYDHRQLDNLKYINIRDRNNIYLAIQQN